MLKDESGGIRVNALYALVKLGNPIVIPLVQKALHDEQWYVRQNACVTCGEFKAKKAKSILKKLAETDPKKAVRNTALLALQKIG